MHILENFDIQNELDKAEAERKKEYMREVNAATIHEH